MEGGGGEKSEKERKKENVSKNRTVRTISSYLDGFVNDREMFKIILITLIVSILDRVAQSLSAAMFFVARSEPEE